MLTYELYEGESIEIANNIIKNAKLYYDWGPRYMSGIEKYIHHSTSDEPTVAICYNIPDPSSVKRKEGEGIEPIACAVKLDAGGWRGSVIFHYVRPAWSNQQIGVFLRTLLGEKSYVPPQKPSSTTSYRPPRPPKLTKIKSQV